MPSLTSAHFTSEHGTLHEDCSSESSCYAQGPLSLPWSILEHPLLLAHGFLALTYHVAELALLTHAWGVLVKPMAALCATFAISPVAAQFGITDLPREAHGIRTPSLPSWALTRGSPTHGRARSGL